MRIVSLCAAVLLLTSCAFSGAFDENEYLLMSKIHAESKYMLATDRCESEDLLEYTEDYLVKPANILVSYTKHQNVSEANELAVEINSFTDEFYDRMTIGGSVFYCKEKLKTIQKAADRALQAMAGRIRR